MTWIIVGIVESRSGDVEILPDWCIGKPGTNDFASQSDAQTVRDSMQNTVDAMRGKTAVRYIVLPALDQSLINQLHGIAPATTAPAAPPLSFSNGGAKA